MTMGKRCRRSEKRMRGGERKYVKNIIKEEKEEQRGRKQTPVLEGMAK